MRVLNPKFALASAFFAWIVWLAMTGKLNEFIGLAKFTNPAGGSSALDVQGKK